MHLCSDGRLAISMGRVSVSSRALAETSTSGRLGKSGLSTVRDPRAVQGGDAEV
jgi:hypothetical protein